MNSVKGFCSRTRKRIADSEALNESIARSISAYIRYVHKTSTWRRIGYDKLEEHVKGGESAIVVLWHDRVLMTPYFFPLDLGPAGSVTSNARAGKLVSRVQRHFGLHSVSIASRNPEVGSTKQVLRLLKDGVTMGFAADGPRGPARTAKAAALVWAKLSGKKVFLMSYSMRKVWRAKTWDRMLVPLPYNDGVLICREWTGKVGRRASESEMEDLRQSLEDQLNQISDEADRLMDSQTHDTP